MALILFAPDVVTAGSPAAAHWVLATCRSLQNLGHEVLFHPRERDLGRLGPRLTAEGVEVLPYDAAEADHEDAHGHAPRFRARRVVIIARQRGADFVLVQGGNLALTVAGAKSLVDRLWSLPVDVPFRDEPLSVLVSRRLSSFVQGSKRLLVLSETQRASMESKSVEAVSRLTLWPSPRAASAQSVPPSTDPDHAGDLEVCLDYFAPGALPDLMPFAEALRGLRSVPRVVVTGASDSPAAEVPIWRGLPGTRLQLGGTSSAAPSGLVPPPTDPVAHALAVDYHLARGARPVLVSPDPSPAVDPRVLVLSSSADLAGLPDLLTAPPAAVEEHAPEARVGLPTSPAGWQVMPRSSTDLRHADGRHLRVVIAGADLKFAGDLILALQSHPDVDLRIDLFKANATPQPEVSQEYVDWADVVIAEFASKNALWYADHVRPNQRLIVHLHGYELLSDWIDDLRTENCAAIVVASEFYRDRALAMKPWPQEMVRVVPNSVDAVDLQREKFDDARFHLGMAGYVPILKRPDRALELLRMLRREDERYVLHFRGHRPWNYQYEWKKSAHQDAYRRFFQEVGADRDLLSGLAFESFGPDIGNWFRRIGWVLSPSTRETFHLAGVEGATSGAVPLVWEREGSREIFSDRWNFADTRAIADFVLATNASAETFAAESRQAQDFASRYSAEIVAERWLGLIRELVDGDNRASVEPNDSALPSTRRPDEDRIVASVETALLEGSYASALEVLDAQIAVTAKADGRVKDAELWVRGVASLDLRRLSLYLPRTEDGFEADGPVLHVEPHGGRDPHDAEPPTLRIRPYPFADPAEAAYGGASGRAAPDSQEMPDHRVRADRWIEAHTGRIMRTARSLGAASLKVRGPWWTGVMAALAGDRLGLPVVWTVTDAVDVRRAAQALAHPYTADHVDHLALRSFEGMARVIDETGTLGSTPLARHVNVLHSGDRERPGGERRLPSRPVPSPDFQGIPQGLERSVEDVRVLVAGDETLMASWEATGVHVESLDPLALPAMVGADVDLVVVDPEVLADPVWRRQLCTASPAGQTGVSRFFDRVRIAGGRSVVLGHGDRSWPEDFTATLRKADRVTVADPAHAERLLTLNPLAVERVLPTTKDHPWQAAPAAFLRWTGLPVRVR